MGPGVLWELEDGGEKSRGPPQQGGCTLLLGSNPNSQSGANCIFLFEMT